jgi:ATP adenylyltransferase
MREPPLWAPWRLAYITGDKPEECIFCAAVRSADDAAHHVVHRGNRTLVMLNAFPYAPGHLMVAPHRHAPGIEELNREELVELMTLTRRALAALRAAMSPDGFNVGLNLGKVAGAGFDDHVHQHVVPRWEGDNNFMPVLADIRVVSQALDEARAVLVERFAGDSQGR